MTSKASRPDHDDEQRIALHHGGAIWVLSEMGFRGAASAATFNEYIKSLRKFGLPFAYTGAGRAQLSVYRYEHMMELALALSLRVYNALPDAVLQEIIVHRKALYPLYHAAFARRREANGRPLRRAGAKIPLRGLFLDLDLNFNGGTMGRFGPPKLITAFEALQRFAETEPAARAFHPINISAMSAHLVTLCAKAPSYAELRRRTSH